MQSAFKKSNNLRITSKAENFTGKKARKIAIGCGSSKPISTSCTERSSLLDFQESEYHNLNYRSIINLLVRLLNVSEKCC